MTGVQTCALPILPFREAHHIVGEAVVEASAQGKPLEALTLADLQKFSPVIADRKSVV